MLRADGSSDRNVSQGKIVALEEQRHVELASARIGKTVPHIERSRVPSSAVSFERL
jgi:hypothetical protein